MVTTVSSSLFCHSAVGLKNQVFLESLLLQVFQGGDCYCSLFEAGLNFIRYQLIICFVMES